MISDFEPIENSPQIYIYGAGFVAKEFYNALSNMGINSKVCGVIVSKKGDCNENVGPYKAQTLDEVEIPKEALLCVAVHISNLHSVVSVLHSKGITNYIHITSEILVRLQIGSPIVSNKNININEIIKANNYYSIPIRYLVLDEINGKNSFGCDIYLKYIGYFSTLATAKARLQLFEKMYSDMINKVFKSSSPIILDENLFILDGTHRITISKYMGGDTIKADIYHSSSNMIRNLKIACPNDVNELKKIGLNKKEIDGVLNMYEELKGEG